jgi:hypothetical protein
MTTSEEHKSRTPIFTRHMDKTRIILEIKTGNHTNLEGKQRQKPC